MDPLPGYVYAIRTVWPKKNTPPLQGPGDLGAANGTPGDLFKIGYSAAPVNRIAALQIGCPFDLQLMVHIRSDDAPALEKRMHCLLESHHVRGEWFAVTIGQVMEAFGSAMKDSTPQREAQSINKAGGGVSGGVSQRQKATD
jgi:hypothetical protein